MNKPRFREKPRNRYVTDEELAAFLKYCSPFLRAYVDLKMMTGLRQSQMLQLTVSNWNGQALTVPGSKGGRPVIYSGEGLQAAVENCIRSRPKIRSVYLIALPVTQPDIGDCELRVPDLKHVSHFCWKFNFRGTRKCLIYMAPPAGLEPATC